ncbi:unnamed protein product [Brachionus calyciflorus]|uniref:Uncharacterized protein n=1 Tax=Brachionus calyciflorus TaxID=104777 RepID=A0A813ZFP7_9BILA|nr:unnamed protein product [Brachionus calyciflorus]
MLSQSRLSNDLLMIRGSNNFNHLQHHDQSLSYKYSSPSLIKHERPKTPVSVLRPINLSLQKNPTGIYLKKDTYTEMKLPSINPKSRRFDEARAEKLKEIEREFLLETFKTRKAIKSNLPFQSSHSSQNLPAQNSNRESDYFNEYRKMIKERNLTLINDNDTKYENYIKKFS